MPETTTSRAQFEELIELINGGAIGEAVERCDDYLRKTPGDVTLLGLMGAMRFKQQQHEEAEQYLRRAIELAPSFAKPAEDLGLLLLDTGRDEEAVEVLRNAVRLDPGSEIAQFNLGKALARVGRGAEADQAFEAAFELDPTKKLLAEAARQHGDGKLEEAERSYREVLRTDPDNATALRMLAMLAATANHMSDAEKLLRRALEKAPDYCVAHIDLGRIFKEQDRYEDAAGCFRRAIELEPRNPQPWYLLGATLAPAALTYDAIEAYQRCLALKPEHPAALLGLGHTLKTVGRQEEGISAYKRCIELKPDNGETYWSLANLKTFRFSDDELRRMEDRVASGEVDHPSSLVNFHFALAKAYEDRGDFETAWQWYDRGNHQQRELVSYDPVHAEMTNEAILATFDSELLDRLGDQGCLDASPIFVVGLPRSGSTLIEQILASHSMVEGTSELPYLARVAGSLNRNRADGINYPEAVRELGASHLRQLGTDYLGYCQMHRTEGRPRFIDKMPNNFPNLAFLHLILPNAKIVDARRHPLDACVGNYRQLFAKGQNFTYDLQEIGEYYLQYQHMMDAWHERLPGRILTVQYEDTVADLETQVRRLLDYCGLPFEEACLHYWETDRPVRTASSEQVRQPIYADSLGYWKNYRDKLGDLVEVLEPILPRYAHLASA
jgi:tetratricopeptide (TPR) repeat protein